MLVEQSPPTKQLRPLKSLPGPLGIPLLGNALAIRRGMAHLDLESWCRRYGPLFRFCLGRTQFVGVGRLDVCRRILLDRPGGFRRISRLEPIFSEIGLSGLFAAEGDDWKRQRQLIMPAFKPHVLRPLFPVVLRIAEGLSRWFEAAAVSKSPVCLDEAFMRFTIDVTTEIVFGQRLNTLGGGRSELQQDIALVFETLGRRVNAPLATWRFVHTHRDRQALRAIERIYGVVASVITESRQRLAGRPPGVSPQNLLEAMLVGPEEGEAKPLSDEEISGNVLTLLLAGEDTTANTLAFMVHALADRPQLQTRLGAELQCVLPGGPSGLSPDNAQALELADGCAQEVLRLWSTAPLLYLESTRDTELGRVAIPSGTALALLTRWIATRPEHFTRPDELIPERWFRAGPPPEFVHEPKAQLAFGTGPRICPGRALALLEIKAVLAILLSRYRVCRPPGSHFPGERFNFTVGPESAPVLIEHVTEA